jgi:hypothetical protein
MAYLYGKNRDYDPGPVTHYCDPTKATNGAGTIGDPYQPSQAMALTTAWNGGTDKVHVLWSAGTHTAATTGERHIPALRPGASGTAACRIVHRATNAAAYGVTNLTIIATNATSPSDGGGCPAFGSTGQDYVIWDGFKVVGANAHYHSDTGHVVFHDGQNCEAHRCHIVGETLNGIGDNYCGIRFDQTVDTVIRNCKVEGIRDIATTSHNIAGLMCYGSTGFLIEHNHIFNCNTPINIKGTEPANVGFNSGETRYNFLTDCYEAVVSMCIDTGSEHYFHHNLVTDFYLGLKVWQASAETFGPTRAQFNTFAGQDAGSGTDSSSYIIEYHTNVTALTQTFTDNIVVMRGIAAGARIIRGDGGEFIDIDRNRWYNSGQSVRLEYAGVNYVDDIAGWRTATGDEAGSSIGDPQFTNAGAGDYTLAVGSPCLTMGTGSTEIGAYGGSEDPGLQPAEAAASSGGTGVIAAAIVHRRRKSLHH